MNQVKPLKLATPVFAPEEPPALGATTPRRWHTVVIEAPEHTNYSVEQDQDGLLRISIYAPGEQIGAQRTVQRVTTWSDRGAE